jgi:ribosomal protein S18 acetylase RimI-like enzyme
MVPERVQVTYLELRQHPGPVPARSGVERVAVERLALDDYLGLYRGVGGPVRWDQRLRMPATELQALLHSGRVRIYVLRDGGGEALGFCEFDRAAFPEIELKHFGVVPEAQGRGLGSWLLATALESEWHAVPTRVWLHTDTWDHPAALPLYQRAGFEIYDVRHEAVDDL